MGITRSRFQLGTGASKPGGVPENVATQEPPESRMARVNVARLFLSDVHLLSGFLMSESNFRIEFLSRGVVARAIPTFVGTSIVALVM